MIIMPKIGVYSKKTLTFVRFRCKIINMGICVKMDIYSKQTQTQGVVSIERQASFGDNTDL